MKVLCILNPIAGGGRTAAHAATAIHQTIGKSGMAYDIVYTQQAGDGLMLARQAAKDGYSHVVAVGGDGTINEIATGLLKTDVVLGILPVGSGNGLARALQIPLEYRDACQLLLQGTSRAIDVGQVNERYFFATSGIGFDAHVGKRYNEHPGHSRGILPYIHIAAAEYFHYTPREITFAYQGKSFTCTPFVLTVANVEQYGAGAIIAPDAIPDDGLFDVVIIPQTPLLRTVYHLPRLFNGTIDALPDFITHRTASLTITRPEPGPVHVDGETFVAGEVLEYTLLPHALRVQVPEHVVPRSKPPKPGKPFSGDTVELLEKTRAFERARNSDRGGISGTKAQTVRAAVSSEGANIFYCWS